MWYSTHFLRLYSELLEDWIKNNVNDGDVQQAISYMHDAYEGNPENLSKETYPVTDYNKLAYRCAYLYKYAPLHTTLVYEALSRALTENPRVFDIFRDLAFQRRPLSICSLGSGPGTDVIGVLAALHDKLHFVYSSATLVDIMPEWERTFQTLIGKLRLENHIYGVLSRSVSQRNFDWSFISANLQEEISQDIKKAIKSADLITMVKFVSAVACKKTSKMVEKIFGLMRPGAMVLFIDNAGGGFQELITSAAQKHNLIPVFGPLNHELYVNETLNQQKFGYKSCFKTRVALQLLMKTDPVQYSTGVNLFSQQYAYPQRHLLPHFHQSRNIRMCPLRFESSRPVPFHMNGIYNYDPRNFAALRNRHSSNPRGLRMQYPSFYPFFA